MLPNFNKKTAMVLLLGAVFVGGIGFYIASHSNKNPPQSFPDNTPVPTQKVDPSITETPSFPIDVEIVDQFYCKDNVIYGVVKEATQEPVIIIPSWCNTIEPEAFENTSCRSIQFAARIDDAPIHWAPNENNKITQVVFPTEPIALEEIDLTQCNSLLKVSLSINQSDITKVKEVLPKKISNISISGTITEIPEQSFADLLYLHQVTLPDSITAIQSEAFLNCNSLTCFEIPEECSFIADDAFLGCMSLSEVHFNNMAETFKKDVFINSPVTDYYFPEDFQSPGPLFARVLLREGETLNIHVPEGSNLQGEVQNYWQQITSEIVNYDGAYFKRPAFVLISE